MKRKPIRRHSVKRRSTRAIQPNLRNGTHGCHLLGCLTKMFSPVMKALGMNVKRR